MWTQTRTEREGLKMQGEDGHLHAEERGLDLTSLTALIGQPRHDWRGARVFGVSLSYSRTLVVALQHLPHAVSWGQKVDIHALVKGRDANAS